MIADSEITNGHTDDLHPHRPVPGAPVPTGIMIARNRIHDCGLLPAANHDHGIYIAAAGGTVIRDNLIYDNADRGVQLYPQAEGTQILDNVIDGNGQGVIFGAHSDDTVVHGNIITNSNVRHNIESIGVDRDQQRRPRQLPVVDAGGLVRGRCRRQRRRSRTGSGSASARTRSPTRASATATTSSPARCSPCRAMGPAAGRGSR